MHFYENKCMCFIGITYLFQDKRGLALDGQLKHEDTNLASSTMYAVYESLYMFGKGYTETLFFQLISWSYAVEPTRNELVTH